MEKKVFILSGKEDSGKTETFRNLFKLLCRDFSNNLVYFNLKQNNEDFIAVFQNGENRIGFYSDGDGRVEVRNNIIKLKKMHKCDFIFGTVRPEGRSMDALIEYVQEFYGSENVIEKIKKIEATDADNERAMNDLYSRVIPLLKS